MPIYYHKQLAGSVAYPYKRCYYLKMNATHFSLAGQLIRPFTIYAFLVICSTILLFAPPASAHTLKTDGTISAALHFEPDDDPMSGKAVTYILFLNDTTKRFSFGNCDCTITIRKDGKTVSTNPMKLNSQNIIGGSITFPEGGAYEVVLHGSPIKNAAFQPFTLKYPQRVIHNPDTKHSSATFAITMSMLVAGLVIVALLIKARYSSLKATDSE